MFDLFGRNGFDYQPPGDIFRMRRPTTGGIMPPHPIGGQIPQFHPMLGGNHPAMQAPQFNTGGNLPPRTFAPMTGGNMPAHPMTGGPMQPQQFGGLAGLFRRGMY